MEFDKCCGFSYIIGDYFSFKLYIVNIGLWDKIINLNKVIYVIMILLIWCVLIKFLDFNVLICE